MTYIDETGIITLTKVMENRCLVEVGESSHVFNLLKLWRIHLLGDIEGNLDILMGEKEEIIIIIIIIIK